MVKYWFAAVASVSAYLTPLSGSSPRPERFYPLRNGCARYVLGRAIAADLAKPQPQIVGGRTIGDRSCNPPRLREPRAPVLIGSSAIRKLASGLGYCPRVVAQGLPTCLLRMLHHTLADCVSHRRD